MSITVRGIDGGAGHGGDVLVFKNTGAPCVAAGYPGVDGVAADGSHVVSAQRTPNGYLGGPKGEASPVTLATGDTASALLEGTNGAIDAKGPCPAYASLKVIAPEDTVASTVPWPSQYPLCYPEIHPIVPGETGAANAAG